METYGWRKVFKFTFIQTAKSKSFIISSVLICALVFAMMLLLGFLPNLFGGDASGDASGNTSGADIKKVYFADYSGITAANDYREIFEEKNITFEETDEEVTALSDKVMNEANSFMVAIMASDSGYYVYAGVPADESVTVSQADEYAQLVYDKFAQQRLINLGVSADDTATALLPVNMHTSIIGEKEENPAVSAIKMVVPMLSSLILFILIFVYGQLVAQSIAQEKTSRVMELLLTSVRPLAVIIGKILAMGTLSLLQFLMFIVSGLAGGLIAVPMLMESAMENMGQLDQMAGMGAQAEDGANQLIAAFSEAFAGFSPFTIIYIFIVFLVGFIFYALIAGLFGASVSRTEDLNAAMQPYSLIGVVGFYLAYFPNAFNGLEMAIAANYIPLSSPFALPSALLTGMIDIPQALIALFVLLVCTVLMVILVARVYEQVIFHTGNRLKFTDILGLAKKK